MVSKFKIKALLNDQNLFVQKSLYDISEYDYQLIYEAVNEMSKCKGIIYFTGVGKNGHVASLAASTFASLGIKCSFINPVEAVHGDMGVITKSDVIFAVSKSGNTQELINFLSNLHNKLPSLSTFLLTSNPKPDYGNTNVVFVPTFKEMIYDIVPTTSILNYVSILQVIAISVSINKKLTLKNFKSNHPGGTIGQTLKNN
jgi:arabinose-5-phosphate isomerase